MQDKEIITKLKSCKTVDELKTVGKEIGYELTDDEAKNYLDSFAKSGEISDNELSSVSGGGCSKWRNGRAYSGNPDYWLITTIGNSCSLWTQNEPKIGLKYTCYSCHHCDSPNPFTYICRRRKFYNDPLNP